MAAPTLEAAPVLSTPDTHIFEDPTPAVDNSSLPRLSDEQIHLTYEIERTVCEIREAKWKRIALQFPDQMLVDAPKVYDQLARGLKRARTGQTGVANAPRAVNSSTDDQLVSKVEYATLEDVSETERLFILADTSYGACCVDEVAAEHVDADVVVHYGRSCLSPPSRLPVIYVFTTRELDIDTVIDTFKDTYSDASRNIILMADIPYSHHLPTLHSRLIQEGYTNIFQTEIVHNPSSLLPNRTLPAGIPDTKDALRDYQLFHISEPPKSLLLTLSSRVAAIHICPTDTPSPTALVASTSRTLNRRYALLTSLTTASVFGILINTLSVKDYMHILSHVKGTIASAGKKSYTFVVGKINAAKVANFSEIGGWVVIGCWESSLIESQDFWKPIITPFELGLALQSDDTRVWTGEWTGDFQAVLEERSNASGTAGDSTTNTTANGVSEGATNGIGDYDSEEESEPPEFDLRTGRYVSHSRPMRTTVPKATSQPLADGKASSASTALAKRANGELTHIGNVVSPGAEFLRSKRIWQGLGSDYRSEEDVNSGGPERAAKVEEGRTGIARGYVVGDNATVH